MSIVTVIQKFIIIASQNIYSGVEKIVIRLKRHNVKKTARYLIMVSVIGMISCNGGTTLTEESPTRGNIKIIADESFQPLIDTEVYTFTHLYQNASIKVLYKPEYDVINDFMRDSAKVIVTSKKLTEDQIQYLRDTLIIARTTTFAYDALAFVINKQNVDSLLTYKSVRDIFMGYAVNWKDIDPKSKRGKINVIFDNTKSGNIRYFKERFDIKTNLPANFFAVNNNAEVIDYVSKHPDALGIISVNWISDKDDKTNREFINKIRVVAISQELSSDGYYYKPQQGFIYDKEYPFVREIYLISRETFKGLGSGFIQWATAEQGQKIVLKSGLVPATMPIRLVQMKN